MTLLLFLDFVSVLMSPGILSKLDVKPHVCGSKSRKPGL
jgi:hypothetical protein